MSNRRAYVLEASAAASPGRAGAKAATLARLSGKFIVPDFFVITADAFTQDGLRAPARAQALPALAALGQGPLAVRSSACDEDGAEHAHAGQFSTELGVCREEALAAAERVWRSGFSAGLARYRAARGLSGDPQPPAVIVQRLIEPRAAGVAFSCCPLTGAADKVVISAVAGRADRLVGGEIDGETYYVGSECAVRDEVRSEARVLSEADCLAVAALARACATELGAPQDVEWAFDGDVLYLLQARPITSMAGIAIWDNSNIIESYPGVVSPLTYAFARHIYTHVYRAFARLMGVTEARVEANREVFEQLLGRIDGRVYYNLLNWYRVLALFPGFASNRAFMEQMMGVSEALPPPLVETIAPRASGGWARAVDTARLVRVGAGLVFHALALARARARFCARLDAGLRTPDQAIDAMSAQQLVGEFRRLERLLLTRWDAPLINDFLCMIAFGLSRRVLSAWAGAEGLALHGDMMIGQGGIVSAEPARRILEMGALARRSPGMCARLAAGEGEALSEDPELAAAFNAYLGRFGDRCVHELKLESRSLHEDARPLMRAIAAAAGSAHQAKAVAPGSERLAQLFRDRPLKRLIAGWLLKWAKARVRDRENLRFERTRLFGRARRLFNTLGARLFEAGALETPRDVFFLTLDEALAAVEQGDVASLRQIVRVRRAEDARDRQRPDPPERIDPTRPPAPAAQGQNESVRAGLGCCAGVITARVRVIADPSIETLARGEILVAAATDPGWIAAFVNAGGIITERGSLLSHSAIVARELGLPCVVGLKGATQWLKTGDLVRLDGGAGLVERVGP